MDFAGFAGSMMGDLQGSQTGGCVTGDGKTGMSSSMRLRLRASLTFTGILANWSGTSSVARHNLSRLTWTVSSFFPWIWRIRALTPLKPMMRYSPVHEFASFLLIPILTSFLANGTRYGGFVMGELSPVSILCFQICRFQSPTSCEDIRICFHNFYQFLSLVPLQVRSANLA